MSWPSPTVSVTKNQQGMYLIDGSMTWQGNYETGGVDIGTPPLAVTSDPTLKKLTFQEPQQSNLIWADSGSPRQTFNSVTGIHPLSDIQLASDTIYNMFNVSGPFNEYSPISYNRHDPKSMSETLRMLTDHGCQAS